MEESHSHTQSLYKVHLIPKDILFVLNIYMNAKADHTNVTWSRISVCVWFQFCLPVYKTTQLVTAVGSAQQCLTLIFVFHC